MKKIYLLVLTGVLIGLWFAIAGIRNDGKIESSVVDKPKITATQAAVVVAKPVRIVIPSIQVDAKVEWVGVDSEGNMDVPKDFNNTAWYEPGSIPGESGSAVIDGHVDTPKGSPAVFADVNKLQPGSIIEIIDERGKTRKFAVKKVVDYELGSMPLDQIFSRTTHPILNLITCAGEYDRVKKMYKMRTVVYSDLISSSSDN